MGKNPLSQEPASPKEKKKNLPPFDKQFKSQGERKWGHKPHDIDPEIELELQEEVVELSEVGCIPVGVEQSEPGIRISEVKCHDFIAALGVDRQDVHGTVIDTWDRHLWGGGGGGHCRESAVIALLDLVGGRRGREEGELRRQLREQTPHSHSPPPEEEKGKDVGNPLHR